MSTFCFLLTSCRLPADQRRHHCVARSSITWGLVADRCVDLATAAGSFPAIAAATTATTAATTNKSCVTQQLGVSLLELSLEQVLVLKPSAHIPSRRGMGREIKPITSELVTDLPTQLAWSPCHNLKCKQFTSSLL